MIEAGLIGIVVLLFSTNLTCGSLRTFEEAADLIQFMIHLSGVSGVGQRVGVCKSVKWVYSGLLLLKIKLEEEFFSTFTV